MGNRAGRAIDMLDFQQTQAKPSRTGWGVILALAASVFLCALFVICEGAPLTTTRCVVPGPSPQQRELGFFTRQLCVSYPDYGEDEPPQAKFLRSCFAYPDAESSAVLGFPLRSEYEAILGLVVVVWLIAAYQGMTCILQIATLDDSRNFAQLSLTVTAVLAEIFLAAIMGSAQGTAATARSSFVDNAAVNFCGDSSVRFYFALEEGAMDACICAFCIEFFVAALSICPGLLVSQACVGDGGRTMPEERSPTFGSLSVRAGKAGNSFSTIPKASFSSTSAAV